MAIGVRIAVLADVHGNAPALRAVLAEVSEARADAIVVAGDVVGGPQPREALELLAARASETSASTARSAGAFPWTSARTAIRTPVAMPRTYPRWRIALRWTRTTGPAREVPFQRSETNREGFPCPLQRSS